MFRRELVLPILLLGSLWGLVEVLPVPVWAMCAAGVLFLTIGRRIANVRGSSAAIGLVVCLLKTYAVNFHLCNLSGILSIAVSFEVFSSVLWRNDVRTLPAAALRGALTCALALPVFVGAVLLFRHPYWVAGGWDRIVTYALTDTVPAMLLSLVSAPLGVLAANWLREPKQALRRIMPVLYTSAAVCAWVLASVQFVERVF